jgi:hypothetical protein
MRWHNTIDLLKFLFLSYKDYLVFVLPKMKPEIT